jgi:hypothetical protein
VDFPPGTHSLGEAGRAVGWRRWRRVKGKLLRVAGRGNASMESSRSGRGPRCRAEAVRCRPARRGNSSEAASASQCEAATIIERRAARADLQRISRTRQALSSCLATISV